MSRVSSNGSNMGDLVRLRTNLGLGQHQAVLVRGGGEQMHLVTLTVDRAADGLAVDHHRDQSHRRDVIASVLTLVEA
jgi:hypothetical protein